MLRGLIILIIISALVGAGFFLYTKIGGVEKPPQIDIMFPGPDKTVEDFYKWYLEFKGQALVSRAYIGSPYLTEKYIKQLDDKAAGYKNLMFDPILCAQDLPKESYVENVSLSDDGNTAKVIYYEDYYGTPIRTNVYLVLYEYNKWLIDNIECVTPQGPDENLDRQVIIYFFNHSRDPQQRGKKEPEYRGVYGVARTLEDGEERYKGAIRKLFEGPSEPEQAQGFSSLLTTDMFRNFFVLGNTAYVDFAPVIKEKFTSSIKSNVGLIGQQIEETLKHNKEIEKVIYAINNDPVDFYVWSGIGCPQADAEQEHCSKRPFIEFGKDTEESVENTEGEGNNNPTDQ